MCRNTTLSYTFMPFLQVREELVDLTLEFKANRHPIGARVSFSPARPGSNSRAISIH